MKEGETPPDALGPLGQNERQQESNSAGPDKAENSFSGKEAMSSDIQPILEPQKKHFVIKLHGQESEYLQTGDQLFECDKNGRPERYVGRIPKRMHRGFTFH